MARPGQQIDPARFTGLNSAFWPGHGTWEDSSPNENQSVEGEYCCCSETYIGPDNFSALLTPEDADPPDPESGPLRWKDWDVTAAALWIDMAGQDLPDYTFDGHDYEAVRLANKNELFRLSSGLRDVGQTAGITYRSLTAMETFSTVWRWEYDDATKTATVTLVMADDFDEVILTWAFDFSAPATPKELDDYVAVEATAEVRGAFSRRRMPGHVRIDSTLSPDGGTGVNTFLPDFRTGTMMVAVNKSGVSKRLPLPGQWHAWTPEPGFSFPSASAPQLGFKLTPGDYRLVGLYDVTQNDYRVTLNTYNDTTHEQTINYQYRPGGVTDWDGVYVGTWTWGEWSTDGDGVLSGFVTLALDSTTTGTPPASITFAIFHIPADSIADINAASPPAMTSTSTLGWADGPAGQPSTGRYFMPLRWLVELLTPVSGGGPFESPDAVDGYPLWVTGVSMNSGFVLQGTTPGPWQHPQAVAGWLTLRAYPEKPYDWQDDENANDYIGPWRPERYDISILRVELRLDNYRLRVSRNQFIFDSTVSGTPDPFSAIDFSNSLGFVGSDSGNVIGTGGSIRLTPLIVTP